MTRSFTRTIKDYGNLGKKGKSRFSRLEIGKKMGFREVSAN